MFDQLSVTAREAFDRGDEVLQLAFPLVRQSGRVVPMIGGETTSTRSDVTRELNRVIRLGWSVVSASVVFVQTGEVSRDKFFTSGQNVAISGEVVGYYLFTRDESKRVEGDETPVHEAHFRPPVKPRRAPGEITPLAPIPDE